MMQRNNRFVQNQFNNQLFLLNHAMILIVLKVGFYLMM